ncbi:MAG: hypothetical protein JW388_0925 [Nitrospira sp.]|nr:hypothetical protein [Nitrospira sp.]
MLDAQKAPPARPEDAKSRIVLGHFAEVLSEARTKVANFFSILAATLFFQWVACRNPGLHTSGNAIDMAVA